MKHTNDVNDVEEVQNVNTLSEIEEYYKAREQQLLKKLHQQGAALAAAEQALKQLTENQKYRRTKQPDSALHGSRHSKKSSIGIR